MKNNLTHEQKSDLLRRAQASEISRRKFLELLAGGSAAIFLASCAPRITSSTSTTTTSTTTSASLPEVQWKFQMYANNQQEDLIQELLITQLVDKVKQRTNGKFVIQPYWYGELGIGWDQNPQACGQGIVDMGHTYAGYHFGDIPVSGYSEMPMLWSTMTEAKAVFDSMRSRIVDLYAGAYNVDILVGGTYPWCIPQLTKSIPDYLDWGGIKVRSAGKWFEAFLKSVGATPVYTAYAEMYTSMKLGVIDGISVSAYAGVRANLWELYKYVYYIPVATGDHYTFVNPDSLAALPSEYKSILLEESANMEKYLWDRLVPQDTFTSSDLDFFKSKGINVIYPPADKIAQIRERCKPIWDQWANETGSEAPDIMKQIKVLCNVT